MVIAVEPQPYLAARILVNGALNRFENLLVFAAAVGEVEGPAFLHDQPPSDRSRLSLDGPSVPGDLLQRFRVPVLRLDRIFEEAGVKTVHLLKVDTEGHEDRALRSVGDYLVSVENVIVEICDPDLPASLAVATLLRDAGFILRDVEGHLWDGTSPLIENNLWAARAIDGRRAGAAAGPSGLRPSSEP
jgi:FkbM family methyltransferase